MNIHLVGSHDDRGLTRRHEVDMSRKNPKKTDKNTPTEPALTRSDEDAAREIARRRSERPPGPLLKMDFDDETQRLSVHFDHEDETM